ncbi:hypothetical protein KO465_04620 [Candidatus Micrarchaeota archaeon]|nr:hypothetical protein [Candidatus Micrarchaeota archaeon]
MHSSSLIEDSVYCISLTIVDEYNWEHGLYSIMLIKEERSEMGLIFNGSK